MSLPVLFFAVAAILAAFEAVVRKSLLAGAIAFLAAGHLWELI